MPCTKSDNQAIKQRVVYCVVAVAVKFSQREKSFKSVFLKFFKRNKIFGMKSINLFRSFLLVNAFYCCLNNTINQSTKSKCIVIFPLTSSQTRKSFLTYLVQIRVVKSLEQFRFFRKLILMKIYFQSSFSR